MGLSVLQAEAGLLAFIGLQLFFWLLIRLDKASRERRHQDRIDELTNSLRRQP